MTPLELSIMASVFLVVLMTALTFMFFFSTTWERKDDNSGSDTDLGPLLSDLYSGENRECQESLPDAILLETRGKEAAGEGHLIESVYNYMAAAIIRGEAPLPPPFLREVLLPDITRIRKYIPPEIFHDHIAHNCIDNPITVLFNALSQSGLDLKSDSHGGFGLKPEHQASNHRKLETVSGYTALISRVFLKFEPDIYFRPDLQSIYHAPTIKLGKWFPSLVIGGDVTDLPENEIIFSLARKIALFRPELRFLTYFDSYEEYADFAEDFVNNKSRSVVIKNLTAGISPIKIKFIEDTIEFLKDCTVEDLMSWRKGALLTLHRCAFLVMPRWIEVNHLISSEESEYIKNDLSSWMVSPNFFLILKYLDIIPE